MKTLTSLLLLLLVACQTGSPVPPSGQEKTLGEFCLLETEFQGLSLFGWDSSKCEEHVVPKFQLPIHYWTIPDGNASMKHIMAVDFAANYWNEKLGFKILRNAEDALREGGCTAGECLDVSVIIDPELFDEPGDPIGYATVGYDANEDDCFGRIVIEDSHPETWKIAVHEFGHIFGLVHDQDNILSIMYPVIVSNAPQDITVADLDALRALYGF